MSEPNLPFNATESALARLDAMWAHAGIADVAYPVETADVLRLLDGCEYRADADFLVGLMQRGTLPVPLVDGRRLWNAEHVMAAVAHCESRRRWKWPSTLHGMKFSQVERLQAEAEAEGKPTCFDDLDQIDLEVLLVMLAEENQRVTRDLFRVAILAKLRAGEGLL